MTKRKKDKPDLKILIASRRFWMPRMPILSDQCASCPFREGNDPEFGEVVGKLAATMDLEEVDNQDRTDMARARIKRDCTHSGEFACHHTAYNEDMSEKPRSEHRQCPGAAEWYKTGRGL